DGHVTGVQTCALPISMASDDDNCGGCGIQCPAATHCAHGHCASAFCGGGLAIGGLPSVRNAVTWSSDPDWVLASDLNRDGWVDQIGRASCRERAERSG